MLYLSNTPGITLHPKQPKLGLEKKVVQLFIPLLSIIVYELVNN